MHFFQQAFVNGSTEDFAIISNNDNYVTVISTYNNSGQISVNSKSLERAKRLNYKLPDNISELTYTNTDESFISFLRPVSLKYKSGLMIYSYDTELNKVLFNIDFNSAENNTIEIKKLGHTNSFKLINDKFKCFPVVLQNGFALTTITPVQLESIVQINLGSELLASNINNDKQYNLIVKYLLRFWPSLFCIKENTNEKKLAITFKLQDILQKLTKSKCDYPVIIKITRPYNKENGSFNLIGNCKLLYNLK